ncbi:hypothetical protein AMJ57_02265 [Parcubacteria bacterium SG8_24]|nr:MAG: hypothetical protein AMJ57_02265 [Parcubacteria bacterium SG8_24]
MQRIVFDLAQTDNPDEAVGHARYVINADHWIGDWVLTDIVQKHVPTVDHPQVRTTKVIIRTDRYECPCCNTSLTALVRVICEGLMTDEWAEVQGLYRVDISPDHGRCKVVVEKLTGTKIHEGRCDLLPRKDYDANPEARQEIEEREKFFEELARQNPGRVLRVDGVETAEDMEQLARVGLAFAAQAEKDEK